jgi:hypothetical protein
MDEKNKRVEFWQVETRNMETLKKKLVVNILVVFFSSFGSLGTWCQGCFCKCVNTCSISPLFLFASAPIHIQCLLLFF